MELGAVRISDVDAERPPHADRQAIQCDAATVGEVDDLNRGGAALFAAIVEVGEDHGVLAREQRTAAGGQSRDDFRYRYSNGTRCGRICRQPSDRRLVRPVHVAVVLGVGERIS